MTVLAAGLSPQGLVTWLQGLFGPLFLGAVGIGALFHLFKREITQFVQWILLAIAIAIIFYYPGIIQTIASSLAHSFGVH